MSKAKKGNSGSVGANNKPRKSKKQEDKKELKTEKDYEEALVDAFNKLKQKNAAGKEQVPVHKLRDYIADNYGQQYAGKSLDIRIQNLYKNNLRLRPISYKGNATQAQLDKSIPGMNETLFYLEKD